MENEIRFDFALGELKRVLIGRLKPGSDVMTGLETVCKNNDFKVASSKRRKHSNGYFRFCFMRSK